MALAHGVNHLDIAPRYGDAEAVVGPVSRRSVTSCSSARRRHLAPPTASGAARGVTQRLRTDHVDLYQLHAVTSVDVLEERRGGRSHRRARTGMTRFVGITGHDLGAPAAFVEALRATTSTP